MDQICRGLRSGRTCGGEGEGWQVTRQNGGFLMIQERDEANWRSLVRWTEDKITQSNGGISIGPKSEMMDRMEMVALREEREWSISY
jgi:hypothetical protein